MSHVIIPATFRHFLICHFELLVNSAFFSFPLFLTLLTECRVLSIYIWILFCLLFLNPLNSVKLISARVSNQGESSKALQFLIAVLEIWSYMHRSSACMCVCGPSVCLVLMEAREGVRSPETGVTDSSYRQTYGYRHPDGHCEWNLGHPLSHLSSLQLKTLTLNPMTQKWSFWTLTNISFCCFYFYWNTIFLYRPRTCYVEEAGL